MKPTIGMKIKLIDANDGGVLNTMTVEAKVGQTIEAAYASCVKELERKREGWRTVYPNSDLRIV